MQEHNGGWHQNRSIHHAEFTSCPLCRAGSGACLGAEECFPAVTLIIVGARHARCKVVRRTMHVSSWCLHGIKPRLQFNNGYIRMYSCCYHAESATKLNYTWFTVVPIGECCDEYVCPSAYTSALAIVLMHPIFIDSLGDCFKPNLFIHWCLANKMSFDYVFVLLLCALLAYVVPCTCYRLDCFLIV